VAIKDRQGIIVGVAAFFFNPAPDVCALLASLLVDPVGRLEEG